MAKPSLAAQEKDWQAEQDLRTLIEAEKIRRDRPRLKAAMAKKREMETDLKKIS